MFSAKRVEEVLRGIGESGVRFADLLRKWEQKWADTASHDGTDDAQ